MGIVILIAVLLHLACSYLKLRGCKMKKADNEASIRPRLKIALSIKYFILLPAIILALVFYSVNPKCSILIRVNLVVWINYLGLLLLITSLPLKVGSYKTLGQNWSAKIAIYKQHSLVTTGTYGLVRHPVYMSNLMIALGTFLATGSLSLLMLGLGYLGSDLIRSKEEEALLYQKFGHEYARYRKRVGGFIPMALQHSILVFIIFCNLIGIIDGFIFSLSGYSFTIQVLSSWLPP